MAERIPCEVFEVTVPAGPAPDWTVTVDPRCECFVVDHGVMHYVGAVIDDGTGGRRFVPAEGDG